MEQEYNALRKRILTHLFDPCVLTDATLRRITKIEANLRDASGSDRAETVFRTLCTEAAEQLREKNAAARSSAAVRREVLFGAYNTIFQGTADLLSANVFRDITTVWFTHPSEEDLRVLGNTVSSLISECEGAQRALLELCGLKGSSYALGGLSDEILCIRIAFTLCSDILPITCGEILHELSSSTEALDQIEESDGRFREVGLWVAADLLPPFLDALAHFLEYVTAMHLEASDMLRLLPELQSLQVQLRRSVEPLLKL